MGKLSAADQMMYSATRLTAFKDGKPVSYGTGFFYVTRLLEDGAFVHVLITNKHVIAECDSVSLSLHLSAADDAQAPSGRFKSWQFDLDGLVLNHPDEAVDLCAIMMGPLFSRAADAGLRPFFTVMSEKLIMTEGERDALDSIEPVTMVGCPNGIFDVSNNMPVARRGHTASDPRKRFQGKNEFLVDLACFPGSSGSPVFLYDAGSSFDRASGEYELGKIRYRLLGILYAGPTISNTGEITLARGKFAVNTTMHLGTVIRSTALLDFDRLIAEMAAASVS